MHQEVIAVRVRCASTSFMLAEDFPKTVQEPPGLPFAL